MVVNNKFSIAKYQNVVDEIVEGYFNVSGEYRPDLGRICEMMIFIRECVPDESIDMEKISVDEIDSLLSRDYIVNAYENELLNVRGLSFGAAAYDASKILDRKMSIEGAIETIAGEFVKLADTYLKENSEILNQTNQKDLAKAVVDAYSKSDRFKQVVATPSETKKTAKTTRKKPTQTNRQNVVPMEKKK